LTDRPSGQEYPAPGVNTEGSTKQSKFLLPNSQYGPFDATFLTIVKTLDSDSPQQTEVT